MSVSGDSRLSVAFVLNCLTMFLDSHDLLVIDLMTEHKPSEIAYISYLDLFHTLLSQRAELLHTYRLASALERTVGQMQSSPFGTMFWHTDLHRLFQIKTKSEEYRFEESAHGLF